MSNCNTTIYKLIETYLNMGWNELTTVFTSNLTAKEKQVIPGIDEQLLVMLGEIRKYLVTRIFNCCKKNKIEYFAFGSENITSDYDLTIVGQASPIVVWNMFLMFLKQYDNILPHAFDTNLYCSGIYSPINALDIPQRIDISDSIFVLSPKLKEDITIQIEFALLKLHSSGFDLSSHLLFHSYKKNVLELKKEISNQFRNKNKVHKSKYGEKYSSETIDIITKYYLSVSYAKKINKILYETGNTESLMYFACMSQYFAIESYYTPATVNVVVMNIQGNHKISIKKNEYMIATIENVADFRTHLQNEAKLTKSILLKYSKYMFRILYSLGKYSGNRSTLQHAMRIKKEILPLRKSGDTKGIDWSLLMFKPRMSLKKYIQYVSLQVLNESLK